MDNNKHFCVGNDMNIAYRAKRKGCEDGSYNFNVNKITG